MAFCELIVEQSIFDHVENAKQQDNRLNIYLNSFGISFSEQIQQRTAEIMRMTVREPQLIGDCIQEQIATLVIHVDNQVLENIHVRAMNDGRHIWLLIL